MPLQYTLHFTPPPAPPLGRAAVAAAFAAGYAGAKPCRSDPAADWAVVRAMRWPMLGDQALSERDIADRLAGVNLAALRGALERLALSAAEQFPALGLINRETLWQLIALGPDIVGTAGGSPDFLEFLITQIQPCDLSTLLN